MTDKPDNNKQGICTQQSGASGVTLQRSQHTTHPLKKTIVLICKSAFSFPVDANLGDKAPSPDPYGSQDLAHVLSRSHIFLHELYHYAPYGLQTTGDYGCQYIEHGQPNP